MAKCTGKKIRQGIMWTYAKKYMEMEWTRSGMKVMISDLYCWRGQCNKYLPEYEIVDGMYEELVVGIIAEK